MLRFQVEADDLLRSRFAISPLFELDNLLRKLSGLSPYRLPASWSARLTPLYRRLRATTDLDMVLALHSRTLGPGFAAPPPRSLAQSIEDDLATVRATALPDARREIARCLNLRPTSDRQILAILRSDDVVERAARTLEQAWYELLAADWPQLRALCERDVVHRAGQLSSSGWAAALDGLHPRVRWRDGAIEVLRTAAKREGTASLVTKLAPPGRKIFDPDGKTAYVWVTPQDGRSRRIPPQPFPLRLSSASFPAVSVT